MNTASRYDDIAVFLRVTELGSFSAAAEELALTPSGVSKIISRIEDRLGVKLLQRTTRRLLITAEGETFLKHGRNILNAMEAMEADVTSTRGKPRGLIRVNTGTAFAKHKLVPALPEFCALYPEIEIDLEIDDHRVDVLGRQVDVAIRIGPLEDSPLIARKIGETHRTVYTSRLYIEEHGAPTTPAELEKHNCIVLTGNSRLAEWPFEVDGKSVELKVKGAIKCDSADVLLDLVYSGLGIACTGKFLIEKGLATGDLVEVLAHQYASTPTPITALMPPGRQFLPRVRAFVDFVSAHCN